MDIISSHNVNITRIKIETNTLIEEGSCTVNTRLVTSSVIPSPAGRKTIAVLGIAAAPHAARQKTQELKAG